jgi:isoprenylcysteine carboxyl methyltransferase (ICMT) family protein YpbQ
MVLGIVFRQWSIVVLGSFFSNMVGVQTGQKVVDKGRYHLVRSPAYWRASDLSGTRIRTIVLESCFFAYADI